MAKRRMFSLDVIDTDLFVDMPTSSQNLYFHLCMRADDDGFISSPNKIMKMIGSNRNDIDILLAKKFLIPFESGVCVIRHWKINNYLRNDRYTETIYKEEKKSLIVNNDIYEVGTQSLPSGIPTVNTGKDSIGKVSEDKISNEIVKKEFIFNSDNLPNTNNEIVNDKVIEKPQKLNNEFEIFRKSFPHARGVDKKKGQIARNILKPDIKQITDDVNLLKEEIKYGLVDPTFIPATERWLGKYCYNEFMFKQRIKKIANHMIKNELEEYTRAFIEMFYDYGARKIFQDIRKEELDLFNKNIRNATI